MADAMRQHHARRPVQFAAGLKQVIDEYPNAIFLEVGPGKVLSGLVRRIDREAPSSAFCAPADLVAVRAFLA